MLGARWLTVHERTHPGAQAHSPKVHLAHPQVSGDAAEQLFSDLPNQRSLFGLAGLNLTAR